MNKIVDVATLDINVQVRTIVAMQTYSVFDARDVASIETESLTEERGPIAGVFVTG